jgi:DNA-binding NtrC family response regulator
VPKIPFGDDDTQIPTVSTERPPAQRVNGLRISVVSGPDAGLAIRANQPKTIVGRSPASEVRLSDPTASSFHVELCADSHGVLARDLESLNGTVFQGARIGSAVIPSGATLQIGSSLVRVELDVPLAQNEHSRGSFGDLCGTSRTMRELFTLLERIAGTELALLIEGPTGTGKELAARAIHAASAHAAGSFVVLDCTAIPASLAESVLFGHERGAFTGATERRPGVFEAAGDGTVFLDEVGELPLDLQPKLLRALEQRQVVRVGSSQPIPVRARVLSATWRDLRARVNQGTFREDLYYRLAQARVPLPALRERTEDIPLLVRHILERIPEGGRAARSISTEALKELCQREYAGNVRELRHTVERAAMLAAGDVILPSDLAFERMLMGECKRSGSPTTEIADLGESLPPPPPTDGSLPMFKEAKRTAIEEFERDYLARLLARAGNNLSRASALAGVERHHLRDLLRKRGLWGE